MFGNAMPPALQNAATQFAGSPFGQRLISEFGNNGGIPGVNIPVGPAPQGPTQFANTMRDRMTPEERRARLAAMTPEERAARQQRMQDFWQNGPPPHFLNMLQGFFNRLPPGIMDKMTDWRQSFLDRHPNYQSPPWIGGLFGQAPPAGGTGSPVPGVSFGGWNRGWGRRMSDDPDERRGNLGNSMGV